MSKQQENTVANKKIVVTGATGGIGMEISRYLYAAGGNLVLTSRNASKLKKLAESLQRSSGGTVQYMAADFMNTSQVESFVHRVAGLFGGSLDVLINNAGIGYHGLAEKTDIEELKEVFSVNVFAPIILSSRLLPHLQKSGAGHVINVSSILGSRSMPRTSVYTASKHALSGYSKVLRKEAAKHGIRVTVLEPGAIATPFIDRTRDPEAKEHFSKRRLIKLQPGVIAEWIVKIIESDSTVCPEVIQIMPQDQII